MLDGFGVRHSRAGGYDPFRLAWSTGFAFRPTFSLVIVSFLMIIPSLFSLPLSPQLLDHGPAQTTEIKMLTILAETGR